MNSLLLMSPDNRQFDLKQIAGVLRTNSGFHDIRFDEPGGAALEAEFGDEQDWTILALSDTLKSITLSGISDASLRAALVLQQSLAVPLRMVDSNYSFDLILAGISSIAELKVAMQQAQTG